MGLRAFSRTKDQAPTGDLSTRLAAVRRCSAAPLVDESGAIAPDARLAAVDTLAESLRVVAEAARVMREAAALVIEAAGEPDEGPRALLAERYDDARMRVDAFQEAMPAAAEPLLGLQAATLEVPLRGATYAVAPFPLVTGEAGLDLPPPEDGFATHGEVADTLRRVELALERLARLRAVWTADHAFLARDR